MSTNSCCRGFSVQNRVQDHPQENSDSKKPFFPFFDFFVVVIAASHSVPPHLHGGNLCPFGTVLFLRQFRHWYTPEAVVFSPVFGHVWPHSKGGSQTSDNLRGRCDAFSSRTARP